MKVCRLGCSFLWALCVLCGECLAGPLNPPPGPIAPTPGPEPRTAINATNTPGDANSVFRITQPGSYYLTGNVTGVAGFRGIEVASASVVIDLNGFALTGVAGSLQGIVNDNARSDVTVRNGAINGWGLDGINLVQGATSNFHRVEYVRVSSNGGAGINVGNSSVVRECISENNGGNGYTALFNTRFERCSARFNDVRGFGASQACMFLGCSAIQSGLDGFFVTSDCVLRDCLSLLNTGHGIEGNSQVSIIGCVVNENLEHGLFLDDNCMVIDCIVEDNDINGILMVTGGRISGCVVDGNGQHGIDVFSAVRIVDNTCEGNGRLMPGAGIHLSGSDNHVEGNRIGVNDWGMQVTAGGNFIARNIATGNATANWDIAANNKCLVVLGANAAAFSGDSGGSSPGSTNPNANYTY